jgi:Bacteriocin-protection, YdeI or OmpD-Associated/Domain of unknown function (DUF1905)
MEFRGEVILNGKTATGIQVPDGIVEALGAGQRPAVRVTLRGYTYRTTIAPMGGAYWIGVSAEHRGNSGIAAGDVLDVTVEVDDAPRTVSLPDDLAAALAADPTASQFFATLSYTNQNTYVQWVNDAKKAETRADRIAKTMTALHDGTKRR